MKLQKLILIFVSILAIASCKKEAGDGGNSSIRGKVNVELRDVLENWENIRATYPAIDEDVYIIYDNHVSPDDRVQTNYNGEFEFLYLRPGKYKVYVVSKDTIAPFSHDFGKMTVLREVEITDDKQRITLEDMTIYDEFDGN
ncbi:MAG: hypothetical protein RL040_290 [Bacteroidota bacterium]|jgi:hypothetical protein